MSVDIDPPLEEWHDLGTVTAALWASAIPSVSWGEAWPQCENSTCSPTLGKCQVLPKAGEGAADLGKQTPIKQRVNGDSPSPAAQAAIPKTEHRPWISGAQWGYPVAC